MAGYTVVRRIALYDNSRFDENGVKAIIRLPWDLITVSPGLDGAPLTDYLEPIDDVYNIPMHKSDGVFYHGISEVDAKTVYVPANHGSGGENIVEA